MAVYEWGVSEAGSFLLCFPPQKSWGVCNTTVYDLILRTTHGESPPTQTVCRPTVCVSVSLSVSLYIRSTR